MSEQAVLAIIGLLATTVGALIWVIKYMFDKLLPVIESLKEAVDNNAKQTKENKEYLEHRNGRDSKIWKETFEAIKELRDSYGKSS